MTSPFDVSQAEAVFNVFNIINAPGLAAGGSESSKILENEDRDSYDNMAGRDRFFTGVFRSKFKMSKTHFCADCAVHCSCSETLRARVAAGGLNEDTLIWTRRHRHASVCLCLRVSRIYVIV